MQNITTANAVALKLLNMTLPLTSMSEDCLYLSIYTPAHASEGSNLPVSTRTRLVGLWEHISSTERLERTRSAWAPCSADPVEKPLTIESKKVLLIQREWLILGHGVMEP